MEEIKHNGRIIEISPHLTKVEIISRSACQDCAARTNCGLADCMSKIIEISRTDDGKYTQGEEVSVSVSASQGYTAVFIVYILPLILLILSLYIMLTLKFSEQVSGIFSIIILIPYYFGIFLCQKRLHKQFHFTISKK